MIDFTQPKTLYYLPGYTSTRIHLEGLTQLIVASRCFNSSETAAYMFCNPNRNLLRVLYWDTHWFLNITFPIQKGRLQWPAQEGEFTEISLHQLERLLQGDTIKPRVPLMFSAVKI